MKIKEQRFVPNPGFSTQQKHTTIWKLLFDHCNLFVFCELCFETAFSY